MTPTLAYKQSQRLSPVAGSQRMLEVYTIAIEAAKEKKEAGVRACLSLLRHTLNPVASPEIAFSLEGIYRDCDSLLEEKDYGTLIHILEAVRGAWDARIRIDTLQRTAPVQPATNIR